MNTETTPINEAAATITGIHTRIKVGSWRTPRRFFASGILLYLEVTLECIDCKACQDRLWAITNRMKDSGAPHLWAGDRWLILVNEAASRHSVNITEGSGWKHESYVLEFLSKTIGEKCVLVE
jgi:hypothetical protein